MPEAKTLEEGKNCVNLKTIFLNPHSYPQMAVYIESSRKCRRGERDVENDKVKLGLSPDAAFTIPQWFFQINHNEWFTAAPPVVNKQLSFSSTARLSSILIAPRILIERRLHGRLQEGFEKDLTNHFILWPFVKFLSM